jgi:nuclear pore complex protein Nup205
MAEVERWLLNLAEKIQSASILEQAQASDLAEITVFQRMSLRQQHESLGAIVCHLIRANHTNIEDFHILLDTLKRWTNMT